MQIDKMKLFYFRKKWRTFSKKIFNQNVSLIKRIVFSTVFFWVHSFFHHFSIFLLFFIFFSLKTVSKLELFDDKQGTYQRDPKLQTTCNKTYFCRRTSINNQADHQLLIPSWPQSPWHGGPEVQRRLRQLWPSTTLDVQAYEEAPSCRSPRAYQ